MNLRRMTFTALFLAALLLPSSHGFAAQGCKTPDGFLYPVKTPAGKNKSGKGIGGTGIRLSEGGKGMGGTGIDFNGPLGIYGRITGFGSVCVNGLEVQFNKNTQVHFGKGLISAKALHVGQMVAIVARGAHGDFVADRIAVKTLLSGKVESVDAARGVAHINGQIVSFANTSPVSRTMAPGDHVSVAGFRDAGRRIVATYIAKGTGESTATSFNIRDFGDDVRYVSVQGYVSDAAGDNEIHLAGHLPVDIPDSVRVEGGKIDDISADTRVLVFGEVDTHGQIQADTVVLEHADIDTKVEMDASPEPVVPEVKEPEKKDIEEGRTPEGDKPDGAAPEVKGSEQPGAPEMTTPEAPQVPAPEGQTPEITVPEVSPPPDLNLPEPPNQN